MVRKGDRCICPIEGHQDCVIAEGDSDVLIDDVPEAFDGHKITCGAVLICLMPNRGRN